MSEHSCIDCLNVPRCPLLRTGRKNVKFDRSKALLRGENKLCKGFKPLSNSEKTVRELFTNRIPIDELLTVEALYNRKEESVEDPPDEDEEEVEDIPDFRAMIWDGMTIEERKHQLEFKTEDGENYELLDSGDPVPRGSFALRDYLIHVLGVPVEVVGFWKKSELIQAILFEEEQKGWIQKTPTKGKKKDSENMPKKMMLKKRKPVEEPEVENEETGEEEEEAPSGPATSKKVPKRRGRPPKSASAAKAMGRMKDSSDEEDSGDAGSTDLGPIIARLEQLEEQNKSLSKQVKKYHDTNVMMLTMLHDAVLQRIDQFEANATDNEELEIGGNNLWTDEDPQTILTYIEDNEGE